MAAGEVTPPISSVNSPPGKPRYTAEPSQLEMSNEPSLILTIPSRLPLGSLVTEPISPLKLTWMSSFFASVTTQTPVSSAQMPLGQCKVLS